MSGRTSWPRPWASLLYPPDTPCASPTLTTSSGHALAILRPIQRKIVLFPVAAERYITREPGAPVADRMATDLLIAFNTDPEPYLN